MAPPGPSSSGPYFSRSPLLQWRLPDHQRHRSTAISSLVAPSPLSSLVAQRFSWACALWLHLAFFAVATDAALWRNVLPVPQKPSPQQTVSVEIVTAPLTPPARSPGLPPVDVLEALQAEGYAGKDTETKTAAVPPSTGARRPPKTAAAPRWVTAHSFLAADVLRDPRSAQARLALASLTGTDTADQLCALEAMEQLRRDRPGFRPTRLAPHAFRNASRRGDTVHVTAGAVRSNRVWHELAYRCRLDEAGGAIAGFEYALGEPVDRTLWDDHGLAPLH